jgi:ATP-dependent Clp protease ATP-binding subunit ClpA
MDKLQHLGSDFTTGALCIIEQLEDRAAERSLNLNAYLPEMLFWTVLRWERKVAIVALEQIGINRWKLEESVDDFLRTHRSTESVPHPLEAVKRWAAQQATFLGTNWKGSEHLLLAAIAFSGPPFRSFLTSQGVEYESVKQSVLQVLGKA